MYLNIFCVKWYINNEIEGLKLKKIMWLSKFILLIHHSYSLL